MSTDYCDLLAQSLGLDMRHCARFRPGTPADPRRRVRSGAEFDHVFHHGLNRPEHGWLVCAACHGELTYGGYLAHFARIPEFRIFQARVLAYR